jgi:hypothetical protein
MPPAAQRANSGEEKTHMAAKKATKKLKKGKKMPSVKTLKYSIK